MLSVSNTDSSNDICTHSKYATKSQLITIANSFPNTQSIYIHTTLPYSYQISKKRNASNKNVRQCIYESGY